MEQRIREIFPLFDLPGDFAFAERLTSGHINDTFRVHSTIGDQPGFCFQRVNTFVFKKVEELMANIVAVNRHLEAKNPEAVNLKLFRTRDNKPYLRTSEGEYWRVFNYIDNSHVYDQPPDETIAFEGGFAFGNFMNQMSDLDPSRLFITIPDFHDFFSRWKQYEQATKSGNYPRRKLAETDIWFVKTRADEMGRFMQLIKQGTIPKRITHNDTKFNNILFSEDNKALCIIDLDTVMPGSALFDYGDAIRTVANSASEDEMDLEQVHFDEKSYTAYTAGYLEACAKTLTKVEKEHLPFSARYMTFLIGLRFLTDYLLEDQYYKTTYPEHNLHRARVQFHMLKQMERVFKKK